MKFNVDKKSVLYLVSGVCAIGSAILGLVREKNETNEAAEKAAKIVMKKMSQEKE